MRGCGSAISTFVRTSIHRCSATRSCCAALRGNAKSAPFDQQVAYGIAVGVCEGLKNDPNGRAALDAFNRFGQEGSLRDIPAVLLLDQNHSHWDSAAQTGEHRCVAKMPIKMRDLRSTLVEAMQKKVS